MSKLEEINKEILVNSRFKILLHAIEIGLKNPSMNANVQVRLVYLLEKIYAEQI